MSPRTVIVLAVALAALLALVLIGQRSDTEPAGGGVQLVPGLEDALGALERVTVVKSNNETVATLERRADDWIVTEKYAYPADATKLRQALMGLAEASVLEQKTANAALYGRLGVEDIAGADAAGLAVTLSGAGREWPTVILGNAEGSRYRYARRAGESQSYLVDRNPNFPRTAAQWLDSVIIDVRIDRIREVTITHPDGEIVRISKTRAEPANFDVTNVPEGRELAYRGVANVIGNALRELNLEDVEPAAANPVAQPTTVEYRTFDGLVVRVTGGERNDESWISFEASVDTAQAPAPAAAADPGAAATVAPAVDPASEAARINAKVGGWRYKIASFQYGQMTRRMADLLKAPAA